MDSIKKTLHTKLKSAQRGKEFFLSIYKKCKGLGYGKIAYLIFPEHDTEINYYGLLYLDEFLLRSKYGGAVVISADKSVCASSEHFSKNVIATFPVSDDEMAELIDYYALLRFLPDAHVLSLDKPVGRRGTNLLGKKGLSVEQMIAVGVYLLNPFWQCAENTDLKTALCQKESEKHENEEKI